jgi:hypothetical protein
LITDREGLRLRVLRRIFGSKRDKIRGKWRKLHKVRVSKVHTTTGNEDPDVKKRYSSTLSLTSELDGVGVQRHAPAALPSVKIRYHLFCMGVKVDC